MGKILILLLALGLTETAFAKSWSDASKNTLTLKLGFVTPSLNTEFKSDNDATDKVMYRPSSPTRFSLGAGYGPFSASYGFPGVTSDETKAEQGESKISDWQFRFFGDVHTFDFFYQKYTGYYMQNSETVDPTHTSPAIRPDISNEHYGFQYFYNFHPDDVSIRAAFDQSSVQTKSGGGLLAFAASNYYKVGADSVILPPVVSARYGDFANYKGGVFTSFKAGIGGAYTLVYSNWFASGLLTIGAGPQSQLFDVGTTEYIKASKFTTGSNLKIGAGYNSKNFFATMGFFIDTQNIENENFFVTNSTIESSLWVGGRF